MAFAVTHRQGPGLMSWLAKGLTLHFLMVLVSAAVGSQEPRAHQASPSLSTPSILGSPAQKSLSMSLTKRAVSPSLEPEEPWRAKVPGAARAQPPASGALRLGPARVCECGHARAGPRLAMGRPGWAPHLCSMEGKHTAKVRFLWRQLCSHPCPQHAYPPEGQQGVTTLHQDENTRDPGALGKGGVASHPTVCVCMEEALTPPTTEVSSAPKIP